jgi:hypothetical protein
MRSRRVSPSMGVALAALMVALGGTSYAVVRLPANSVGAKQLKKQAVTRAKIKASAVTGSKVATNSLTGADINEATLGQVPSALNAVSAASAAASGSAAALGKITYRGVTAAVAAAPDATTTSLAGATASCDSGLHAVGGGVKMADDLDNTAVVDSYPESTTAWTAHVDNSDTASAHSFSVFVICIPAGAVG